MPVEYSDVPLLPSQGEGNEQLLLSWTNKVVSEGLAIYRKERAYNEMPASIKYVSGEQYPLRSRTVSRITDNRLRKVVLEIVSALTDVRPIWNYETNDLRYEDQAKVLNKLARGWWKNSFADRKLQSTLTYSCVGGSGFAALIWNPLLPGGGDIELIPYDPRDVLPIEPVYSDSLQDWRGIVLRQSVPVETVRQMYPSKAFRLGKTKSSWFSPMDREGGALYNVISTAWSILTRGSEGRGQQLSSNTDLIHIFVKDESIHVGDGPMQMGEPDSNYAYTVYPVGWPLPQPDGTIHSVTKEEAKLYPRGRLIICTPDAILSDGPNPYWHGLFPVVKFTLDPMPWSILGAAIVGDLIPIQNALNEALRGIEDGTSQWLRRGVVADMTSISKENLNAIDTRKAGGKYYLNPGANANEGFKIIDGPVYPPWYMEMLQYYKDEMDEISGVRGLQQLAQLKQMPSKDTIDKFMDALSPMLRIRARSMEVSLSELAEMLKVNFFQYYTLERRLQFLGKDGAVIEDFDYDPKSLVPAETPGESREVRARIHHRNFKFSIAPNSFLNISHTEHKMLVLQLFRDNIMDPWSLWKELDISNTGPEPADTVVEKIVAARKLGLMEGPTPELVQAQQQLQMLQMQVQAIQAQMMLMQMTGGMPPGAGAPPPEGGGEGGAPAAPSGAGVGANQEGRPPSGQQPPQMVQKDGGTRTVVSESGR